MSTQIRKMAVGTVRIRFKNETSGMYMVVASTIALLAYEVLRANGLGENLGNIVYAACGAFMLVGIVRVTVNDMIRATVRTGRLFAMFDEIEVPEPKLKKMAKK